MITLKQLLIYNKCGFPLVALKEDSETPAIRWSDVYNHPEYWTDEKLRERQDLFYNVATTFGKVKINGKIYWLNCVDVDGEEALRLLKALIEDLRTKTFVVKTKKGYHVYWLSSVQNPAIGPGRTKKGYEFEIKTDNSCGLTNLPPSVHRKDSKFRYTNVGKNTIMHDDTLYGKLLEQLKEHIIEQTKSNPLATNEYEEDLDLDLDLGNNLYEVLIDSEIDEIVNIFKADYKKPNRHQLVLRIGGCLFFAHKTQTSAEQLITKLHDVTNDGDDLKGRLKDIETTYQRGAHGKSIYGRPSLIEYLEEIHSDDDNPAESVKKIVDAFYKILNNASARIKQTKDLRKEQSKLIRVLLPSQAAQAKEGLAQVTGQILSRNTRYQMISKVTTTCTDCGAVRSYNNKRPIHFSPVKESSARCSDKECRKAIFSTLTFDYEHITTVDIELGDSDKYSDIERLSVKLFEDDTNNIGVSEIVTIVGDLCTERKNGNGRNKLEKVLYAKSLQYTRREEVKLKPEDVIRNIEWKESILSQGKALIPELAKMVAPKIVRNEDVKENILMSLSSVGVRNDEHRSPQRIRMHFLLIGDPRLAKTSMLDYAISITPNAAKIAAQSTTGLSLTAQVTKEEGDRFIVRSGPIPMHNDSLVGLNEFNQLPIENHPQLLDYMEEGKSKPSKFTLEFEVIGNVVIFAVANPIGNEWENDEEISAKDFPTIAQILYRFDLISIVREPTDPEDVKAMLREKNIADKMYTEEVITKQKQFLRKYLLQVRTLNLTIPDATQEDNRILT